MTCLTFTARASPSVRVASTATSEAPSLSDSDSAPSLSDMHFDIGYTSVSYTKLSQATPRADSAGVGDMILAATCVLRPDACHDAEPVAWKQR